MWWNDNHYNNDYYHHHNDNHNDNHHHNDYDNDDHDNYYHNNNYNNNNYYYHYHNHHDHDDDNNDYHYHNHHDYDDQHNDKHDNDRKPTVRDVPVGVLRNDGQLHMAWRRRLLHWWVWMSRADTRHMRRRKCWIDHEHELCLTRYERKQCLHFSQLDSPTATTSTVRGQLFRISSGTPRVLKTLSS